MHLNGLKILVTGGAGYIGSHTVVQLLDSGADVVVLDSLLNSKTEVIDRIGLICAKKPAFVSGDVRDRSLLRSLFDSHAFDAVVHFAGLKAVGESVVHPLRYYDVNVGGSIVLLEEMSRANVKKFVFSSSATVYGDTALVPISEDSPMCPTNPYGRSKYMVELALRDLVGSESSWSVAVLRYFNPVGAHGSGLIGEDPLDAPNNLMPFLAQVASGLRDKLFIFGGDYATPDGTGVRDYIHVEDLSSGHLAAMNFLIKNEGLITVNLGTGQGYSVLEMIRAYEQASGKAVPCQVVDRRPGDVAECYANPQYAKALLGWEAKRSLHDMCLTSWNFQMHISDSGHA